MDRERKYRNLIFALLNRISIVRKLNGALKGSVLPFSMLMNFSAEDLQQKRGKVYLEMRVTSRNFLRCILQRYIDKSVFTNESFVEKHSR